MGALTGLLHHMDWLSMLLFVMSGVACLICLTVHELSNGYKIRRAAIDLNIPLITNSRLASAFIRAFCTVKPEDIDIKPWGAY